ncbi:MAG: DUF1405 domain-containing protein [Clostridia bacterium]|nr:DUF1405 domain-containing protein [Clostridia bacterium]
MTRSFGEFVFQPKYIKLLILVNFIGSIYGYYWYRYQLAENPWYLWPLIPDSPLSSTLFMLAMYFWLKGRLNPAFGLLAFLMVIKYGIWAVVINLQYWYLTGIFTIENWMLTLSHGGMALEGYLFLRNYPFTRWALYLAGGWLVIEDIADYLFGLHPYLFAEAQWGLALVTAIILTIGLIVYSSKQIFKSRSI